MRPADSTPAEANEHPLKGEPPITIDTIDFSSEVERVIQIGRPFGRAWLVLMSSQMRSTSLCHQLHESVSVSSSPILWPASECKGQGKYVSVFLTDLVARQ